VLGSWGDTSDSGQPLYYLTHESLESISKVESALKEEFIFVIATDNASSLVREIKLQFRQDYERTWDKDACIWTYEGDVREMIKWIKYYVLESTWDWEHNDEDKAAAAATEKRIKAIHSELVSLDARFVNCNTNRQCMAERAAMYSLVEHARQAAERVARTTRVNRTIAKAQAIRDYVERMDVALAKLAKETEIADTEIMDTQANAGHDERAAEDELVSIFQSPIIPTASAEFASWVVDVYARRE
jgi:hypothetical protein